MSAVPAGTTIAGNWAADLVGAGTPGGFTEFLRRSTILGRFGTDGIPALRAVSFREPLITQTSGGDGYWTGEGKAKPLTAFSFERTTLEPLKIAAIVPLTEELIRSSNPNAAALVRVELAKVLRQRLDIDFINPAKTAVAGVSPASITNGADSIASTAELADEVRIEIRALLAKFSAAHNPLSTGVWVMGSNTAVALMSMHNPYPATRSFPGIAMTGGTLANRPVIVSDHVGDIVVLMNADDVYLADEGEITIDASREASLEMSDAPAHNSITPTPAQLVSMFQTGSVAFRAERTINWMRRRPEAVVYLTDVAWGGAVPTA